jgi:hypothetical protein
MAAYKVASGCVVKKLIHNFVQLAVAFKRVVKLKVVDHCLFLLVENYEIRVTFAGVDAQIKCFHGKTSNAREQSRCATL